MTDFVLPSIQTHLPTLHKIIKWKPTFDLIVAGHLMGRTNLALAEEFDYTPVRISQILNSEPARILIAEAQRRIQNQMMDDVETAETRQQRIREKAQQRVEEFLDNEVLAMASPFVYLNTIKDFAKEPVSKTQAPVQVQINNQVNNQNVSNSAFDRMTRAIEISQGIEVPNE